MNNTAEYATPEGTLRFERTMEEVTWERGPAPWWSFTDAAGHVHRYDAEGALPTLREVVDEWCHSDHSVFGDGYDPEGHPAAGHLECRECGETVHPATQPGSKLIPVSESCTITETTDNPTAEWLSAGHDVRGEYRGDGRQRVTRTRYLSRDEATAILTRHLEAEERQRRTETQRRAANVFGAVIRGRLS